MKLSVSRSVLLTTGYDYVGFLSRGYLDSLGYSGSYQVPRYDDGVSAEISIEDGVPFGDKTHYRAWVSPQLVSFPDQTSFPALPAVLALRRYIQAVVARSEDWAKNKNWHFLDSFLIE